MKLPMILFILCDCYLASLVGKKSVTCNIERQERLSNRNILKKKFTRLVPP